MLQSPGHHHLRRYCHRIVLPLRLFHQKEETDRTHAVDNALAEVACFHHRQAEAPLLLEKYWRSHLHLWQKNHLLLEPMHDAMTAIDELQEEVAEVGHIQGDGNGEVVACDCNSADTCNGHAQGVLPVLQEEEGLVAVVVEDNILQR